jgi:hypothetical protein
MYKNTNGAIESIRAELHSAMPENFQGHLRIWLPLLDWHLPSVVVLVDILEAYATPEPNTKGFKGQYYFTSRGLVGEKYGLSNQQVKDAYVKIGKLNLVTLIHSQNGVLATPNVDIVMKYLKAKPPAKAYGRWHSWPDQARPHIIEDEI